MRSLPSWSFLTALGQSPLKSRPINVNINAKKLPNSIPIEEQFDTLQLLSPVIDIEESRTSGVGENSNGESEVKSGQVNADDTLTLEALSASKTGQESTLSAL